MPKNPRTLRNASSTRPEDWGTRQEAEDAYCRLPVSQHGPGGVGIILGEWSGGYAIGGVDLDSCRDIVTGALEPWAADVLGMLNTYAEVSPSGTGAKAFFLMMPHAVSTLRDAKLLPSGGFGHAFKRGHGGDHPPAIEVYLGGRYFTVTDERLPDYPPTLRTVPTADLHRLLFEIGPAFAKPGGATGKSDRSARAFQTAGQIKSAGGTYDEFIAALEKDPELAAWKREKGEADGERELHRAWDRAGDGSWRAGLIRSDAGKIIANLANTAHALRGAPELADLVTFDQMARTALLRRVVPGSRMPPFDTPRPLQDTDVTALQEWFQRSGMPRIGPDTVQQAVISVAAEHGFHPVRDYLRSLCWDRKPRLEKWLSCYLGTGSTPYTDKIGRWFLIGMVARILKPGCKCDYMLVLDGPQGVGKSTVCKILAGDWFSDALPALHHGDAVRLSMHLRGKWLIEIAEMSSFGKAEAGALKAFLTQTEERYTPKYGRNEVTELRQCLFVGTTNKSAYLRDETGGRRFWPVSVGTIDANSLRRDRDQLFAEAVAAFDDGADWWPDNEFERLHIAPQQENHFEADAWESPIREWLAGKPRCTIPEVAQGAVVLELARLNTAEQRRISAILGRLRWKPTRNKTGRYWVPAGRGGEGG